MLHSGGLALFARGLFPPAAAKCQERGGGWSLPGQSGLALDGAWEERKLRIAELCQDGPAVAFPDETPIIQRILAVAKNDANLVELLYRKYVINNDVVPGRSKRPKKSNQSETVGSGDYATASGK